MEVNLHVWHGAIMARDDPKFVVRLPAELKSRIEAAAAGSGRSMNAEIVHRLSASFDDLSERLLLLEEAIGDRVNGNEALAERLTKLEEMVEELRVML